MDHDDHQSAGGEHSGGHWETFQETPALPFPDRFPEFSRRFPERSPEYSGSYSPGDRFAGMNNGGYAMNGNENRGDKKSSCFAVSTTFSFFVALTMAFGLYSSETMKVGPNTSMLMNPSHFLVDSIKVESLDVNGPVLYGFYKDPPLDVKTTWYETHKIILPASSHKEWVYYLNKGSHVHISYSVQSQISSSIVLVIAEGDNGLAEWLKDPSYPNSAPSWNTIRDTGIVRKDISHSSTYYIAVGNLNAEYAEVVLNITLQALLYNTSESYYKCALADEKCTFQLFLSHGNAAVLTSPGRYPGVMSGNWRVKFWYEPRWVTCFVGIGGIACILVLFKYFQKRHQNVEQETHRDFERNSLLSHKDDDRPSRGSSCDSGSDDERHTEDNTQDGKSANDAEDKQFCAICFDAPKNSFFVPCGHCAACFGCATKIVESSGACPICRRRTKKVRKIYTV